MYKAVKKVLFVATVVKTHIMEFHIPYLKMFKEHGWETAVAARNDYENLDDCVIPYCDSYYDIPFERSPIKPGNITSYKKLKKIIDEGEYDILHCHTPVGAMIARLAAIKARKKGTHVIYTAHGFHFFKGAPLLNWLIYFPVEWVCSFLTDTLITINHEDYAFAKKHMHAKKIEYVPGVGIDLDKFGVSSVNVSEVREELSIPDGKVWMLNVGELIPRKNQELLIRAIADISEIYLTIAGRGELQEQLENTIRELHLEERVKLLGYRNDISDLCQAADIFALPSIQEGLSVALMEAMACGKPVVCSAIRGNTDLIDSEGGVLFDPHRVAAIRESILSILARDRMAMGRHNVAKIRHYSLSAVLKQMQSVYSAEIIGGGYKQIAAFIDRTILRDRIGCKAMDILLLSVGELNANKNHVVVIRALAAMNRKDVHYVIAGRGELMEQHKSLIAELGMQDRVHLLGYCDEVSRWYQAADIFVFPSFREGLSVSLMEAMASGLPCIVSKIRGNTDLIGENGGIYIQPSDQASVKAALTQMLSRCVRSMGAYNREKIQGFSIEKVASSMQQIYFGE